ncbi:Trichodiene oxygenase [Cytospora mali]|uniref:Trichodiene oxygenase n=1 Tax=Cytospora mali TaxID=578113 RepID=A0A194VAL6_CYTMA|nr:Trichodiene oxygenase [Valsa mali var. pyri (nom. inval.)]
MDSFKPLDRVSSILSVTTVIGTLAAWSLYHVARALYNISPFHPLHQFPGPKLAAATILYEFWFEMVLGGRYTREIKRMHEIYGESVNRHLQIFPFSHDVTYGENIDGVSALLSETFIEVVLLLADVPCQGPIVRISPDELHCNDAAFYDEIYAAAGRKRDKQAHFLNMIAGPLTVSAFGTADHDLHRIRRRALDKFFSRQQILKLETEINGLTQRLCHKLLRKTGEVLDIQTVYSCLVTDLISAYCFGETMGFMEQEGWEPNFREPVNGLLKASFMFRYFPVTRSLVHVAPYLAKYVSGDVGLLMKDLYVDTPSRVRKAQEDHKNGVVRERRTVYDGILESSLPESETTVYRLSGDGFSLVAAGTETTAWTLTLITYFLLAQPETQARVASELTGVDPHNLSWRMLEKLPYLSGVVLEGLRMSFGLPNRTPRIARDEDLVYQGTSGGKAFNYVIPRGTAIGMSQWIQHHDEEVFPDSYSFLPERWLDEKGQQKRGLEKYMVAFSRGSRACLGMNLAYIEIYIATAALVLRVFPRMRLYETTEDDVKYDHDLVVSQPKNGSKGVRVVML